MGKSKTATPEPVAVTTICSVCGLGWQLHGADPTTDDCIRLLKAELASRPIIINQPTYPVPYPYPVYPRRPWGPTWVSQPTTITCQSTNAGSPTYNTPRIVNSTCRAISA